MTRHERLQFGHGFRVVLGDDHSQAAQMTLAVGETEGGADQWLYVVSGEGVALIDGENVELRSNSLVLIRRGEAHGIRNTGSVPLQTLNVYVPPAYTHKGDELAAGRA
jgi:mannose-6-phosphate isomerase-like protein (cupin superfamily)